MSEYIRIEQEITPVRDDPALQKLTEIYNYLTKQSSESARRSDSFIDQLESLRQGQVEDNKNQNRNTASNNSNNKAVQKALKGIMQSGTKSVAAEKSNRAVQNALLGNIKSASEKQISAMENLTSSLKKTLSGLTDKIKEGFGKSLKSYSELAAIMRKANLTKSQKDQIQTAADLAFNDVGSADFGNLQVAKDDINSFFGDLIASGKDLTIMSREQRASFIALRNSGIENEKAYALAMSSNAQTIGKMTKAMSDPKVRGGLQQTINSMELVNLTNGSLSSNIDKITVGAQSLAKGAGKFMNFETQAKVLQGSFFEQTGQISALNDELTNTGLVLGTFGKPMDEIGDAVTNTAKNASDASKLIVQSIGLSDVANSLALGGELAATGQDLNQNVRSEKENIEANQENTKYGKLQQLLDKAVANLNLWTGGAIGKIANRLDELFGDGGSLIGLFSVGFAIVKSLFGDITGSVKSGINDVLSGMHDVSAKQEKVFDKFTAPFTAPLKSFSVRLSEIRTSVAATAKYALKHPVKAIASAVGSATKTAIKGLKVAGSVIGGAARLAGKATLGIAKGAAIGAGALSLGAAGLGALMGNPKEATDSLIKFLQEGVPQIIDTLTKEIPNIVDILTKELPNVLDAAAAAFPQVIDAIVKLLPLVINAISDLLPKVINAVVKLLPTVIQSLVTLLPTVIKSVVDTLPVIFKALVDILPTMMDAIVKLLPTIIEGICDLLPSILSSLLDMLPTVISSIVKLLPKIIETLIDMLPKLINTLIEQLPSIITALIDAIPKVVNTLVDILKKGLYNLLANLPMIGDKFKEAAAELNAREIKNKFDNLDDKKQTALLKKLVDNDKDLIEYRNKDLSKLGPADLAKIFGEYTGEYFDEFNQHLKAIQDTPVTAMAKGAYVNKATPALIGEDGPEAVLPLTKPDKLKRIINLLPPAAKSLVLDQLNSGSTIADAAIAFARSQIGKPYSIYSDGYVCNTLVNEAFKRAGMSNFPGGTVSTHWNNPKLHKVPIDQAVAGMIGFSNLSDKTGYPQHMGIITSDKKWINASGSSESYSKGKFKASPTSKGVIESIMERNKKWKMVGAGYYDGMFDAGTIANFVAASSSAEQTPAESSTPILQSRSSNVSDYEEMLKGLDLLESVGNASPTAELSSLRALALNGINSVRGAARGEDRYTVKKLTDQYLSQANLSTDSEFSRAALALLSAMAKDIRAMVLANKSRTIVTKPSAQNFAK